jgi:ferric-dicitrate binding protein FerR (iron transport regulator)
MTQRYEEYSAQNFALDPSFQLWVLDEDPQAAAFWADWLQRHPAKREAVEEAQQLLTTLRFRPHPMPEQLLSSVWEGIQANTSRKQTSPHKQIPAPGATRLADRNNPFRQWQRLAAGLVGILLISIALWLTVRNQGDIYQTQAGEIRKVRLPDGTSVVMNGQSELKVSSGWKPGEPREVWLEGEAFFEVAHALTPANRFLVHTGGLRVEVLGTSFNVWKRQTGMKVVLQTGKVQLSGTGLAQPVAMQPGELVALKEGSSTITRRRVDTGLYTSWREKRLLFSDTPMHEVAEVIHTRYGYQVVFADSTLAGEQLTYRSVSDDFELLLRLLSESFRLEVKNDARQLIISELPDNP